MIIVKSDFKNNRTEMKDLKFSDIKDIKVSVVLTLAEWSSASAAIKLAVENLPQDGEVAAELTKIREKLNGQLVPRNHVD